MSSNPPYPLNHSGNRNPQIQSLEEEVMPSLSLTPMDTLPLQRLGEHFFPLWNSARLTWRAVAWHLLWDKVQASCPPKRGVLACPEAAPLPSTPQCSIPHLGVGMRGHLHSLLFPLSAALLPAHTPTRFPCSSGDGMAQSSPTFTFMKARHFT